MSPEDRIWLFKLGDRLWHSDSSFRPIPANTLCCRGERFLRAAATRNLRTCAPRTTRWMKRRRRRSRISSANIRSSTRARRSGSSDITPEEREDFRPVRHPLVRTDRRTGRKSLFLSAHAGAIIGWTIPEARMFLRDLTEHATQPQFVYRHRWRMGDLVMWDNRTTMHRARRFERGEVRDVRRTTLAGEATESTGEVGRRLK